MSGGGHPRSTGPQGSLLSAPTEAGGRRRGVSGSATGGDADGPDTATRHAVVAQSHGNLALLEQMLLRLVDDGVDVIHAIDAAAYDVQAVVRSRSERYPRPVRPGEPGFEDFVLASVLSGVVEAPPEALAQNAALQRAVRPRPEAEAVHIGLALVGMGGSRPPDDCTVHVVVGRESTGIDARSKPVRVYPGHLRSPDSQGVPAACTRLRAVPHGVEIQFIGLDGQPLAPAQTVTVS